MITASNGFECLEKLKLGFEGLILMDIMMPKMNGWYTIKEIIKNGFKDKVIIEIISALGYRKNQQMRQPEPYVYDYLNKPIAIKEFIDNVKKVTHT